MTTTDDRPTLLLKRLRSGSRRNATYTAFREVGRVIRTVQLLRYLSDAPLRGRVTAATNKVEAFNGFSGWVRFGQRRTVRANDPVEQEKDVKFTLLGVNARELAALTGIHLREVPPPPAPEGWTLRFCCGRRGASPPPSTARRRAGALHARGLHQEVLPQPARVLTPAGHASVGVR